MAEPTPSSAHITTVQVAEKLWCVHLTGADDMHPMPSRAVALEEANALNTSICRIKREDVDPVLIAVVAEWPHSADSHAAGLMIRDECLRMRGDQAVAAQALAAVAVPTFEAWAKAVGGDFARHNCGPYVTDAMKLAGMAWHAALAATPALPATEDSSAGDLAEATEAQIRWTAAGKVYGRPTTHDLREALTHALQTESRICACPTCVQADQAEVQAEPVASSTDVVYRWQALDYSGYCYGSNPPTDLPERCNLTAFYRQPDAYRAALHEISATSNLTATSRQFGRHLQQIARDALVAAPQAQPADALDAETPYQRGYRHGYNQRDAEVQGALL